MGIFRRACARSVQWRGVSCANAAVCQYAACTRTNCLPESCQNHKNLAPADVKIGRKTALKSSSTLEKRHQYMYNSVTDHMERVS